jgi:hypothetical protein
MAHARSVLSIALLSVAAACASAGGASSATSVGPVMGRTLPANANATNATNASVPTDRDLASADSEAIPMPAEITRAVELRIEDLKARGGDCARYGSVLESSYRRGRITLRPFMWRVGTNLASGEAKPNGDMTLAREIDSLNVGVRTVNDVLASMEHEAVHITFGLLSGIEASENRADQYVRACRA